MSETDSLHIIFDPDAPKSKQILHPDFTQIALSNEEPISKAIEIVFRAKNKSILPSELDIITNRISSIAQGDNIGCLRALQDYKWKQIQISSLIFRIYLKQLIMQSAPLTTQQILECDFNSGMHYDWKSLHNKITDIISLGFSRNEALEAIIVTNNESNTIEIAAQYLLLDEETRKKKYHRAKQERNHSVSPNRHWTIIKRNYKKRYNNDILEYKKKSENELLFEIEKLKEHLSSLRKKRIDLEEERDKIRKSKKLILYKEYIRGIVAEHKINTSELADMARYKMQRKISKEDHINTLKNLGIGYDNDSFDDELKAIYDEDIKCIGYNDYELIVFGFCRKYYLNKYYNMKIYRFPKEIVSLIIDYVMMKLVFDKYFTAYHENECIVCYDTPSDHMFIPCYHICICSWCAEDNFPAPHDGQKCPLCSTNVQDVKQIYYH